MSGESFFTKAESRDLRDIRFHEQNKILDTASAAFMRAGIVENSTARYVANEQSKRRKLWETLLAVKEAVQVKRSLHPQPFTLSASSQPGPPPFTTERTLRTSALRAPQQWLHARECAHASARTRARAPTCCGCHLTAARLSDLSSLAI